MKHGRIVLLDIDIRNVWFPQSGLSNGLLVHGWWRKVREFELTGD